jgi:two-component system sporulation sensor kinase B
VLGMQNLLLNLLFLLLALFSYFSLGFYKKNSSPWVIGTFCGVCVIFCMSFPFTIIPGFIYDLRILPLLVAILYGGLKSGLVVSIVLFLYRYILGGGGFEATVLSYIPIIIMSIFFT